MREDHEHTGKDLAQHRQLLEVLRRLEQPAPTATKKLHRLELGLEVFVVRCLVVGHVVVAPPRHVRQRLEQHRGEVVGQQLDLLVHVLGRHLVHQREVRHHDVHHLHGDIHSRPARIRLDPGFRGHGERLVALPVRHGAERRRRGQQVVQMRGAGAGQARDDDRGEQQVDVVYLRMTREQIGEQQPVLQPLQ